MRKSFIMLAVFLLAESVNAEEPLHNIEQAAQLKIEPHLCILTEQENSCKSNITINWVMPLVFDVCLRMNVEISDIQCWQNRDSGETRLTISTSKNIMFELVKVEDDKIIAFSEFRIIREIERRKRKRRPWSFF